MPISWNEIRQNAIAFSKRWATETREAAERQTFWNELFEVFGQKRRLVASFEEPVKKLSGTWAAIDLLRKARCSPSTRRAGTTTARRTHRRSATSRD